MGSSKLVPSQRSIPSSQIIHQRASENKAAPGLSPPGRRLLWAPAPGGGAFPSRLFQSRGQDARPTPSEAFSRAAFIGVAFLTFWQNSVGFLGCVCFSPMLLFSDSWAPAATSWSPEAGRGRVEVHGDVGGRWRWEKSKIKSGEKGTTGNKIN